ncbi:hypothetical protein vBAbaPP1_178 [Acinetobacter phage vB_AbaM_P1]|nr:hypothetical protein vBAbaPP1_178 [Acinetobacter phage vB_AbaM_P1]WAX22659.1 hypothetical protein [Acinetobacter phage vB_AbaP_HB01]
MLNMSTLKNVVNANIGTIESIDIENMRTNSGSKAPNQFDLFIYGQEGNIRVFKSYDTIIAVRFNGQTFLDLGKWDYSPTTLRYLKQWLGTQASKAEIVEKIDLEIYKLVDLN